MSKKLHIHIRNQYDKNKYWNPGMPLTEKDLELLEPVKEVYKKQGFVPTKSELPVQIASRLKSRFRTWGNVLCAANLPALNNPEEKKKRMEALQSRQDTN